MVEVEYAIQFELTATEVFTVIAEQFKKDIGLGGPFAKSFGLFVFS